MGKEDVLCHRRWSSQPCSPTRSLIRPTALLSSSSCKGQDWWFSHSRRPVLACWDGASLDWFLLCSQSAPAASFPSQQSSGKSALLPSLLALDACWPPWPSVACSLDSGWSRSEPPLGRSVPGRGPSTFTFPSFPPSCGIHRVPSSCPVGQQWPQY